MYINFFVSTIKSVKLMKLQCNVRNYTKTLLGDSITPLTENTLLGRMLVYLNNANDKRSSQLDGSSTVDSLIHGKTSNLHNLNVDQIANLFYTASVSVLSQNKQHLRKVLDKLDVECCLRLTNMEPNNILKLLSAFMHVVPNRITEYKFYNYATDDIDRCLEVCSKQDIIKFIFYIGLQKKMKKAQVILRKCLRTVNQQYLERLTVEDLCIICNSTYRTNTKFTNANLLEKVKQTLNENLSLLKDPALLITLIKTIKHNNYQDEDLLTTISCTIFFNKTLQYYTFTAICHLLSLYSEYLYYDEELFNLFIPHCIQLLQGAIIRSHTAHLTEHMRTKDVKIFLSSISRLNCVVDSEALEKAVTANLQQRITLDKIELDQFIEILLCMWMLKCRPYDLLTSVLTSQNIAIVYQKHPRAVQHLNLLISAIETEDPDLFTRLHLQSVPSDFVNYELQMKSRPLLQKIYDALKSSTSVDRVELAAQVPHLNIVGLTVFKNDQKAVNIELLDGYCCVKNQDCHPNGYMQLKLRILEEDTVPVITVTEKDIGHMDTFELCEFLSDEIDLMA
uniref:RAP domain-containing protein n=1 Tax=Photinus pyralis TaxID=7054 RepID=A0A1Y1M8N7_PHOPY